MQIKNGSAKLYWFWNQRNGSDTKVPHIHHTCIYILWSRVQIANRLPERNLHSWLLRHCFSGDFCACISSGQKPLCVYDTELVRFQPQCRRKWRLHLPLCCQSVWIWCGPQCYVPSQVQVDRQDMPWNYIIIISLVYSSVCMSKSFHSLSEVSFSSLRSLHRPGHTQLPLFCAPDLFWQRLTDEWKQTCSLQRDAFGYHYSSPARIHWHFQEFGLRWI